MRSHKLENGHEWPVHEQMVDELAEGEEWSVDGLLRRTLLRVVSESRSVARTRSLEERLARLEERVDVLESEFDVDARHSATGPLAWITSQPELRVRYAGQHVAVSMTPEPHIVAAAKELDELLRHVGDDLSALYIHQFS